MQSDVLTLVEQALPKLRPAERRIARLVLDSPSVIRDSTISKLADECDTSSTTVTRFVSALGFSGYPEFRMAVSTAVGREQAQLERFSVEDSDIDPNDSAEQVVAKIVFQETTAIEQTASSLDLDILDRVVAAIDSADRIDLFGVASSGLAAQDLQQKLHRIGLISYAWLDPHLALTSAALLSKRSVAIAFSQLTYPISLRCDVEPDCPVCPCRLSFRKDRAAALRSARHKPQSHARRDSGPQVGSWATERHRIAAHIMVRYLA